MFAVFFEKHRHWQKEAFMTNMSKTEVAVINSRQPAKCERHPKKEDELYKDRKVMGSILIKDTDNFLQEVKLKIESFHDTILSRLSDVLLPLKSWVRALYRTFDRMSEEFVNALYRKSWVFSGFSGFLPKGKLKSP